MNDALEITFNLPCKSPMFVRRKQNKSMWQNWSSVITKVNKINRK